MKPISDKTTEQQNLKSMKIDAMETREILELMNQEDKQVPIAVEKAIPQISAFVDLVVERFNRNGSLYYVGAGTSGRLGVLDASEIPPTFSADPKLVQGIIAGGSEALVKAVEGAEDHLDKGREAIRDKNVSEKDIVLGITTSGFAPYVHGALKEAKERGAITGLLICNTPDHYDYVDVILPVIVGPEIVTGSTRLKAGTATKLVLNMISTTAMIKLNKTYGNLMVDLQALNIKLWDRGTRIIVHLSGIEYDVARNILQEANGEVKTALVMAIMKMHYIEAKDALKAVNGSLRKVLEA
ncbi:MAG TPA: N-acetylmuramic acid 6-phosphate etherase [Candidatus Marinimicrobia bacterium]|nr:N-acetylmuramic acid 6-phosphate etherase [Candidatus Neomarinimicrobiota bacterium]